jgi:hypothetical protein
LVSSGTRISPVANWKKRGNKKEFESSAKKNKGKKREREKKGKGK